MLFYRAALPLSSRTLTFVAGIIRRHRASIGSSWRKLNPGKQALLVLVYLRKGETFGEIAACGVPQPRQTSGTPQGDRLPVTGDEHPGCAGCWDIRSQCIRVRGVIEHDQAPVPVGL